MLIFNTDDLTSQDALWDYMQALGGAYLQFHNAVTFAEMDQDYVVSKAIDATVHHIQQQLQENASVLREYISDLATSQDSVRHTAFVSGAL